ncbi:MAG: hypothetical protein E6G60_20060 [Actinobacteria bacterium]|nr:MAG: hypothetical protein E6G60_20060 [Actinomycetota bacterium]
MQLGEFLAMLRELDGNALDRVAASLTNDTVTDEVEWCRATIAIDKAVRHARCGRLAARAAGEAANLVYMAAARAGTTLPDPEVTRVARAAAQIARGLTAGPAAAPIVGLLFDHWASPAPLV